MYKTICTNTKSSGYTYCYSEDSSGFPALVVSKVKLLLSPSCIKLRNAYKAALVACHRSQQPIQAGKVAKVVVIVHGFAG